MNKKQLGNSDLYVSPICFGGNVFGWTIDEKTSFELLNAFMEAGCNFIDTADVYSRWAAGNKGGESETIIGNWLKKNGGREKVIIATKVGSDMGNGDGKTLRKAYILKEADASLQRLQTDYIDLYQTHFDDETLPVDEALEAYEQLTKAGKIRWIGASNMKPERLLQSLSASEKNGFPVYQTLQPEYNLYERKEFEDKYQKICSDHNIGVITYFSLASGFLTGKYRSEADLNKSQRGDGVKKFMNPRGFAILDALDEVAKRCNSTPATVSLAWLMDQPSVVAPIASATSKQQLKSLTDATELSLDKEALNLLNKASEYINQ